CRQMNLRHVDMLLASSGELEGRFRKALDQGMEGIVWIPDHFSITLGRKGLFDLARVHRIPLLGATGYLPNEHFLLAFGPLTDDHERRAGAYVAKILRGSRAGDLPIEQSDRVYLGVNLR